MDNCEDIPKPFPVDGTIDLHTFNPKEIKQLIPDYIHTCLEKGIFHIRIIHGKGTGALSETVHSILKNHPAVLRFGHEGGSGGGWGATVVDLKTGDRRL